MDYDSHMISTKGSGDGSGRIWYRAPDSLRTEHTASGRKTITVQIGRKYSIYAVGGEFIYDCDVSDTIKNDPFLELANMPKPNAILEMINAETLQYLGVVDSTNQKAFRLKGTIEKEFDTFGRKNKVEVNLLLQFDVATGLLLSYEANMQMKDMNLSTKTAFRIAELNVDILDEMFQIDTQGANVRHADIGQMIYDAHRPDGSTGASIN